MIFCTTSFTPLLLLWYEVNIVTCGKYDLEFWERDPKFDYRADDPKTPRKGASKNTDWFELHRLQRENKNEAQLISEPGSAQSDTKLGYRRRGAKPIGMGDVPNVHVMSDIYNSYVTNLSRSHDQKRINQKKKQKLRKRLRKGRREMYNNSTRRIRYGLMQAADPASPGDTTATTEGTTTAAPVVTTTEATRITTTMTGITTTKQTTTKEKSETRKLSPYSLVQFLQSLATTFTEANITLEIIGKTVQYNDLVLLKITEGRSEVSKYFRTEGKYMEESADKKIIFIVHGLSAMGFNSLPCLSEVGKFKELLKYYFEHLDKFDIYLMPMANPDGVREDHRLWNKNTSPQDACLGVALDRNFDVAWNESRKTTSCSQQFAGPSPFSEIETKAIREVFHRYSQKIAAYLHVHAGTYSPDDFKGDAVLYPKGYSEMQSEDDKYIDLKGELDEAMKNASFKIISVTVDTLYNWYGKVSGSSVDYASSIYGIPYAMELVMQLYTNDAHTLNSAEKETNVALKHMWRRLINVIFKNIHRNLNK